jgi:hypothetical protein
MIKFDYKQTLILTVLHSMFQISPIPERTTGTPQAQLASSDEHRSVLAQAQHRSDDT